MTRIDLARASDIGSGIPSGTAFPGSPTADDLFYRTDRNLIYFYDGTRWLTVDLYREPFAAEPSAVGSHSGNDTVGRIAPWHTTYDMWLDSLYSSTLVSTTNDGSNFWTVTLNKTNAANSATSVVNFTTASDSPSTWVTRSTSIGALLTPATYKQLKVDLTKTLSPGNIFCITALAYRLVG